ncbi:MAG: hypothetical protein RR685_09965, partial [Hungatella sp.]
MAQEIIEAVRQAEIEGEQKEKDALHEAEQIVEKAGEEAAGLKQQLTKEARDRAAAAEEEARACGEKNMQETLQLVQQELIALRSAVKDKEEQ